MDSLYVLATLNKTLASANNMVAFIILYLKPLSLLYSSSPFIYLRSLVIMQPLELSYCVTLPSLSGTLCRGWSVEYCWNSSRLQPPPFLHPKLRSKRRVDVKQSPVLKW